MFKQQIDHQEIRVYLIHCFVKHFEKYSRNDLDKSTVIYKPTNKEF